MNTGGLISAATQTKRRLISDTRGSMTIPGIILFTVLVAVSGLAMDMQRVYGVHGEMQAFVDNVALAAAAELDGQSTALTRAFRAAHGDADVPDPLVKGPPNSARFATDTTLTVQKVTFLQSIGDDPGPLAPTPTPDDEVLCTYTAPMFTAVCLNGETVTTASAKAKFVEVVASERTVEFLVLPVADVIFALVGAPTITDQATLRLRATAGFRRAVCNNVPMMMCNPAENTKAGADFDPAEHLGKQFMVKINDGWDPPNFGLLQTIELKGANDLAEALAKLSPGTACTEDTVKMRGGSATGPVEQGMNTRFDMYGKSFQYEKNPNYAPAPVVVRGLNGCNNNEKAESKSMPFPRDDCFMGKAPGKTGPCAGYKGGDPRFGDGKWARQEYWDMNHKGVNQPAGYIDGSKIGGWTRYQTYRYELEYQNPQMMVNIKGGEQGAPSCSNQTPDPRRDHDRRVMYMAVVNCIGDGPIAANQVVPVKAYAKVFLTEPVGNEAWKEESRFSDKLVWPTITNKDLAVEIIGVVTPNDESGHLHVYPVLYR